MKINLEKLNYFEIQQRTDWLDKNVGLRKYVLHSPYQIGGRGWRYYSAQRTIEIEDERWATVFALRWA